ncbi:GroES-like protein [Daedaleopsis nitida]|nr:GroES-like protein [Daedaleopsis nitida]
MSPRQFSLTRESLLYIYLLLSPPILDHPVPPLEDNDILVKTVSVAQNHTDWKNIDVWGRPGGILGCDSSGIVVKAGKGVSTPKHVKNGADLVWVVPDNTLTHDEAATLGLPFWTAVQALYHPSRLGLVEYPASTSVEEWILVYGGSSAVGQVAIRLATLSGYQVVTTASPRNFYLVRSRGATEVFDYTDPEVVSKIKKVTGDSVIKALDTISLQESQRITAEALSPESGATNRKDVKFRPTLIYTAIARASPFGHHQYYGIAKEDRAHMAAFLKKVPQLVQDGLVQPLPIMVCEGGLAAVPEGLQCLCEGKISAKKIVYRV